MKTMNGFFKLNIGVIAVAVAVVCAGCSKDEERPDAAPPADVVPLVPTNPLTLPVANTAIVFDGVVLPGEYGEHAPVVLTWAAGATTMNVSMSRVDQTLYFGVVCYDPSQTVDIPGMNDSWAPSDGLEIYIDPSGWCYPAVTAGLYRIITIPDAGFTVRHGQNDGTWKPAYTSFGIKTKGHQLADRYIFEIAVPFDAVGIIDLSTVRMALELKATDGNGMNRVPVPEVATDKPYTWCGLAQD